MIICVLSKRIMSHGIGGLEIFIQKLYELIAQEGHQIHIFCMPIKGRGRHEIVNNLHVHYVQYPVTGIYPIDLMLYSIFSAFEVMKENKKFRFDVIHAHGSGGFLLSFLRRIFKINCNFFYTTHGTVVGYYVAYAQMKKVSLAARFGWKIFENLDKIACKYSTFIIAASTTNVKEIKTYYGISKDKISIIPDACIDSHLTGCQDHKSFKRPANKEKRIIFVGRLVATKGIPFLLSAIKLALQRCPYLKLVIVGDGPESHALKRFTEELGIKDRVVFKGFITLHELHRLYRFSTAVVMPSQAEGVSFIIPEAMAFGKPVIASPESGAIDIITNEVNGYIVDCKRPELLAEKIVEVALDEKKAKRIGDNARATAKHLTWEEIAKKHITAYYKAQGESI